MTDDGTLYIVDHLTGARVSPDGRSEIVLEPQPTDCTIHLEGDGPIEDYEKNYRIVPVRAWLVSPLPDRLQIDPIIDKPDGEGWIIADCWRLPNCLGLVHPWISEVCGEEPDLLPDVADEPAMRRWSLAQTRRETRVLLRHLVADCGYRPEP